jgi:hypothetical protein
VGKYIGRKYSDRTKTKQKQNKTKQNKTKERKRKETRDTGLSTTTVERGGDGMEWNGLQVKEREMMIP